MNGPYLIAANITDGEGKVSIRVFGGEGEARRYVEKLEQAGYKNMTRERPRDHDNPNFSGGPGTVVTWDV